MHRFSTPEEALQQVFGFAAFRSVQADAVRAVIAGQDVLVLMSTGAGKSLCYQIPALVRSGVAVVVSPLLALMQDQVLELRARGVRASCLSSMNSLDENREVERALRSGMLDILYVTPERLVGQWMISLLKRSKISLFAVDEAHCIATWGHDFRPEYSELGILRDEFPNTPRIALTATADDRTRQEISSKLLRDPKVFVSSFNRPNIYYKVEYGHAEEKERLLHFIRASHKGEAGIVYCLSRKKTEEIARFLSEKGIPALAYHAGQPLGIREENQRAFAAGKNIVMAATVAFGMGIDKENVRFVVHLGLPKSIEAYFQETGRAGRDGRSAEAWLVWSWRDVVIQQRFIEESEGDDAYRALCLERLDAMVSYAESGSCRRRLLLSYFGEAPEFMSCHYCDNCGHPPRLIDRTIEAQKFVCCVIRCQQKSGRYFRMGHVIDVLTGQMTPEVMSEGHGLISTWAIGRDLAASEWRIVARVLIEERILRIDLDGGGILMPGLVADLLRGKRKVFVREFQRSKSPG